MANYTEDKRAEIPDKKPVAMPIGYERPESIQEMIARMVRAHSDIANNVGLESLEEADDFDIDDDTDLHSNFQLTDMQEETPRYVDRKPDTHTRRSTDKITYKEEQEKPVETAKKAPSVEANSEKAVT